MKPVSFLLIYLIFKSIGSLFYASSSKGFWPKNLGEKVSVVDYTYFLVGSTKWGRITCFVPTSIPNRNVQGKKQAPSDRLSQWHLYTVFVAWTPLDTTGQTQLLCRNSTALQGNTRMSLRAPGPIFFIRLIFNSCSCAWEHAIPQKFKGWLHQTREAFLQAYTVPLQGGLAGPLLTLRRKTLCLSTTGLMWDVC